MKFGVQLYNFRVALAEDFKGTIREIGKMGFDGVEFAYFFGGLSPEETAELLREAGLECCGAMFPDSQLTNPDDIAWDYAKVLNPPAVSVSAMVDFTREWQKVHAICQTIQHNAEQKQIHFSYHNHWAEYDRIDGKPAIDFILDAPESRNIFLEPDVCWLTRGKMDPAAYIRKYANRIKQIHFKDILVADDPATTATLGKGIVDLKSSFSAAQEINCPWIIFEQDNSSDPFQSAAESLAYLKSL